MSIFDNKRLPSHIFKIDTERMPRGWYTDAYFNNIATMLTRLAEQGYTFAGRSPLCERVDCSHVECGDIVVEMQWFTRRRPYAVIAGVDEALAVLRLCTGEFDAAGTFHNTFDRLEVDAVHDGVILPYEGDPAKVLPVIRVRGRYRDFGIPRDADAGRALRGDSRGHERLRGLPGGARQGHPVLSGAVRALQGAGHPRLCVPDGASRVQPAVRASGEDLCLDGRAGGMVGRQGRRHGGAFGHRVLLGGYGRGDALLRADAAAVRHAYRAGGFPQ